MIKHTPAGLIYVLAYSLAKSIQETEEKYVRNGHGFISSKCLYKHANNLYKSMIQPASAVTQAILFLYQFRFTGFYLYTFILLSLGCSTVKHFSPVAGIFYFQVCTHFYQYYDLNE